MEGNESIEKKYRSEELPHPTGGARKDLPQQEFNELEEDEKVTADFEDPYADDAKTTTGGPYYAFFAALIVMSLMLAIWLFAALYFGRWELI